LKETRPLWPPQRGVGLQEPNLGKTNPRVTLFICLRFVLHPLSRTRFFITNANPACSCVYICKFQFRPIHPPSRRLSPAMPAPAATEVVVIPVGERPVAADVETADASALGASEEGGVETRSVPPGGSLVAVRRSSEGRRQLLRFRTCEASNPVFVLDDEREDQSWDELRVCAEATVGSLRSSLEVFCRDVPKILQVTVSGIPFLFCDQGVFRDAPLPSLRI
jgi:hypothetical protein